MSGSHSGSASKQAVRGIDAGRRSPSNKGSSDPGPGKFALSIIRAIIEVFAAVFRSAALTLLQFASIIMGAMGTAAIIAFFVLGGAGFLGLRFARRGKGGS